MKQNLINFIKGDVIGAEFEMQKNPTYTKTEIINPEWTDDTSQAFCLIEALIESTDIESFKEAFKEKLIKWMFEGYLTPNGIAIGTGRTSRESIAALRDGKEVENTKLSSGALMRSVPFLFVSDTFTTDYIVSAIQLTHKNPLHLQACIDYLSLYRDNYLFTNYSYPKNKWIGNDAFEVLGAVIAYKDSTNPLSEVLKVGGDTDTTLALIGALSDTEFLPDIKFTCPDMFLDRIEKFENFLKV